MDTVEVDSFIWWSCMVWSLLTDCTASPARKHAWKARMKTAAHNFWSKVEVKHCGSAAINRAKISFVIGSSCGRDDLALLFFKPMSALLTIRAVVGSGN
jgi:hypothetical protein